MEHNVICEKDAGLIILKIVVSDDESLDKSVLERIRGAVNPLCIVLDDRLMELWLCVELSKLHEVVYKIITLMNIPINVYVSGLYGVPQPLLVNGVYNRGVRLGLIGKVDAGGKVIDDETIELLCYDEFHECLSKVYMLSRSRKIKTFNIRKEGTKCRIMASLSEPICVADLVEQCLRIIKPKSIPP